MTSPYTLPGLPSDLLSSDKPGERRLKVDAEITLPPVEVALPDHYPLPALQVDELRPQTDGLTDGQLRASAVGVADDFASGEVLPDQIGANSVLTFTFSEQQAMAWVYAVNPADLSEQGEVRVHPFGGVPSASYGIPVPFGAGFPVTSPMVSFEVFAPAGIRVTVIGYKR